MKIDRTNILGGSSGRKVPFEEHRETLREKDRLYLFSDGFIDQNNAKRKKIGRKKFINLIQKTSNTPLSSQQKELTQYLEMHQDSEFQRDDITVIGLEF